MPIQMSFGTWNENIDSFLQKPFSSLEDSDNFWFLRRPTRSVVVGWGLSQQWSSREVARATTDWGRAGQRSRLQQWKAWWCSLSSSGHLPRRLSIDAMEMRCLPKPKPLEAVQNEPTKAISLQLMAMPPPELIKPTVLVAQRIWGLF